VVGAKPTKGLRLDGTARLRYQTDVVECRVQGTVFKHGTAGVGFWGFGSMLAITLSWSVHHSILWMTLHGILSWLYVIYYAIKR
jgi:hypothetical protein